jgi:hypothetical protein
MASKAPRYGGDQHLMSVVHRILLRTFGRPQGRALPANQLDIPDLIRSTRLSSEPNSDSGVVHSLPCTAA